MTPSAQQPFLLPVFLPIGGAGIPFAPVFRILLGEPEVDVETVGGFVCTNKIGLNVVFNVRGTYYISVFDDRFQKVSVGTDNFKRDFNQSPSPQHVELTQLTLEPDRVYYITIYALIERPNSTEKELTSKTMRIQTKTC